MMNKYTLSDLNTLVPSEFESIRGKGEEFRRQLSDAVVLQLDVPDGWTVNAEYRSEFGGLFPVQCRLSVADSDEYHLCVCSPGEVSPLWLVVLLSDCGGLVRGLHQSDVLRPDAVNDLVRRAAGLNRFNCTPSTVCSMLTVEAA